MKDLSLEEARQRSLFGWYADAVAVHKLTQKSNVDHGGHLTGADLGIAPQSERFRGFGEQPQRVTCLLYFHWLKAPPRRLYLPERHQAMVENLRRSSVRASSSSARRLAAMAR